ncbi:MAG: DUF4876 domain-containing protein [Ignavibacteriaceae bacterium]|nr:DUF4876 domain-containing protein [Ignavibacteriaceae bacterium]
MKSIISNLVNKYRIHLLVFFISVIPLSCNILNIDKIPSATERDIKYKIILKDNSGYMMTLYGSNLVRNAEIMIKSKMQGTEYQLTTDSNGVATISGIISDDYLVTANRWMLPAEMKIISGASRGDIKLTNTNSRIITFSQKNGSDIVIPMEMALGSSPIVISEIYACGPPGAGLYYQDKYVEFYNQTDSVVYVDGLVVSVVFANYYLGIRYSDDPDYVHTKNIYKFPGRGKDYPIHPGQFIVCAAEAINHKLVAPNSIDLSHSDFEFYKPDGTGIDNPNVPNMIYIYQDSGNLWLIGGQGCAIILSNCPSDSIKQSGDQFLIPIKSVMDGVEYLQDPTRLDLKILSPSIDAGATGGIQFYTGKSMERKALSTSPRLILKDDDNSTVDFDIIAHPTPGKYH